MPLSPPVAPAEEGLIAALKGEGHVFLQSAEMRARLLRHGELADWTDFADSWNEMPLDLHMADGGRYRRRRYAVYRADALGFMRQTHQPHYQSRDYNALNGGVQRWFEPVTEAVGSGACLQTVLRFCHAQFARLAPQTPCWHVEVHQFRIEAAQGEAAQPTPEGVHRDGVDYVLVLLVARHNIASGTTTIFAPDGQLLGSFTLTHPCDATLLDDARVHHGVTPVAAIDPGVPAYRDVLVVTFRSGATTSS